jgi:hypothetical protein
MRVLGGVADEKNCCCSLMLVTYHYPLCYVYFQIVVRLQQRSLGDRLKRIQLAFEGKQVESFELLD